MYIFYNVEWGQNGWWIWYCNEMRRKIWILPRIDVETRGELFGGLCCSKFQTLLIKWVMRSEQFCSDRVNCVCGIGVSGLGLELIKSGIQHNHMWVGRTRQLLYQENAGFFHQNEVLTRPSGSTNHGLI